MKKEIKKEKKKKHKKRRKEKENKEKNNQGNILLKSISITVAGNHIKDNRH